MSATTISTRMRPPQTIASVLITLNVGVVLHDSETGVFSPPGIAASRSIFCS